MDNCACCDQELHRVQLPVSRCGDEECYHTTGVSSRDVARSRSSTCCLNQQNTKESYKATRCLHHSSQLKLTALYI